MTNFKPLFCSQKNMKNKRIEVFINDQEDILIKLLYEQRIKCELSFTREDFGHIVRMYLDLCANRLIKKCLKK